MSAEVAPAQLLRPWWRRARLWLVVALVVGIGAVLLSVLAQKPGRPLDPTSAHKNGSKALARLLEHYGARVRATSSLDTALAAASGSSVLVVSPDDYSRSQLGRLSVTSSRLVLVRPDNQAITALDPTTHPTTVSPLATPGCGDPGAIAAGAVDFPDDAVAYDPGSQTATVCYGGALVTADRLTVLGSADALRNENLDDQGMAALDINAITDSRRLTSVVWLMPGSDAEGSGPASLWDLFPSAAHRAFWWLIAVGALLAVWRARRLGAVVAEPLPVIVRSAEVVEGHGRLYARAGARDRAAATLRAATVARLAQRLGLPRGASAEQVAAAAAPLIGRTPVDVTALLAGPEPTDDLGLMRLGHDLDMLEFTTERTTTR